MLPLDDLPGALLEHDVVISCTGSPSYVVTQADVSDAAAGRVGRPLLLLDAALPRDVDPSVRDTAGVTLADMSDLERVAEVNRQHRQQEAARVEAIVEEEVARFHEWWDSLRVVPTLVDLREQAESLREQELERALRRLVAPAAGGPGDGGRDEPGAGEQAAAPPGHEGEGRGVDRRTSRPCGGSSGWTRRRLTPAGTEDDAPQGGAEEDPSGISAERG